MNGKEKYCPKWAFIGAAHFMEKLLEPHEDYATFCSNETTTPGGSTKGWDKKARGLAGRRIDPIETFFGRRGAVAQHDGPLTTFLEDGTGRPTLFLIIVTH